MTTSLIIASVSGLAVAGSFVLGHYASQLKGLSAFRKQVACDAAGALLAFSLLVFLEALLHYSHGVSFFDKLRSGEAGAVGAVYLAGVMQGVVYEYVGQFTFPLWYYPQAERIRVLLLGLPLFWGIFMLILQDTWALFRGAGVAAWLSVLLVAVVQYVVIEGINLFVHSWKYKGFANTPYFLIFGWIILVLTFVVGYNHYFGSPFGF
jgi:hypothetical protein